MLFSNKQLKFIVQSGFYALLKKMFKGKKSVKKEKKKSKLRFGNIFKMFSPLSSKNKVRKFLWLQLHCYEGSFSWQKAKISQATVKEK